jgi:predicted DNA-binding protein (MmcQ/YjbR family)
VIFGLSLEFRVAQTSMTIARLNKLLDALRKFALQFPGAHEEFPWGERVVKVNKKVFIFMTRNADSKTGFTFSVKLPHSNKSALAYPFAEPTGYGLGRSGWVTGRILPGDETPRELLFEWIEESYRTIAPKKLVAELDALDV